MKRLILVLVLFAVGCHTPPTLSPEGRAAFQSTRIVKVLDVIRDAAIAAHDQNILSVDSTRAIVQWHKTSLLAIQAVPSGWKATVTQSLYALTCDPRVGTGPCGSVLTSKEIAHMTPYIGLLVAVLPEIP